MLLNELSFVLAGISLSERKNEIQNRNPTLTLTLKKDAAAWI